MILLILQDGFCFLELRQHIYGFDFGCANREQDISRACSVLRGGEMTDKLSGILLEFKRRRLLHFSDHHTKKG